MNTSAALHTVACPTCATPILGWAGPGPACPRCGLPAAGHAGYVVARIESTLREFRADRDELLRSFAAAAPSVAPTAPTGHVTTPTSALRPQSAPAPAPQLPSIPPPFPVQPTPAPTTSPAFPAPPRPPRRLSPQQLLLGTGGLLLVSAAIAFAAVAWESLSLTVQAGILLLVTGIVCAASVSAARRGLRTTGEALAMAGLALTVVDLVGARVKGLAGLDDIPLRAHAALTLGVVVILGLTLSRVAPMTRAWLIGALVAGQPLAFLALPESARTPVPLVATALLVSIVNVAVTRFVEGNVAAEVAGTAAVFAGIWWAFAITLGTAAAWSETSPDSVLCTVLVGAAGAAAALAVRPLRLARVPGLVPILDVVVTTASALALAGTLHHADVTGVLSTGILGLAVLTPALLLGAPQGSRRRRWRLPLRLAGALLSTVALTQLLADHHWVEAAALAALGAGCSAVVAVLDRGLRVPAAVLAAGLPAKAILLLVADGLAAERAGWLLALLGASTLGVACIRVGQREERPLASTAAFVGLTAVTSTATTLAWGQLALQMSVVGAGLLAYGRVSGQRPVLLVGLAELVLAAWIGAAGHSVTTPEVYTLPAVAALLLAAGRGLRTAPSWVVWGAPLLVGLAPSTLVLLDHSEPLRLVLVVTVATACAVLGTTTHRQAPFLIGLGVLVTVAVSELGPYAELIPRWVSLGTAGIVLLALGATYERRLAQAREAVSWVGGLR